MKANELCLMNHLSQLPTSKLQGWGGGWGESLEINEENRVLASQYSGCRGPAHDQQNFKDAIKN